MGKKFFDDNSGATAIEYALIAALIALAIIPVVLLINNNMTEMFDYIGDHIVRAISD